LKTWASEFNLRRPLIYLAIDEATEKLAFFFSMKKSKEKEHLLPIFKGVDAFLFGSIIVGIESVNNFV